MKTELMKKVASSATKLAYRTCGKLKNASPEIFLGVGIAAVIGGTIMACVASQKVNDIAEDTNDALQDLHVKSKDTTEINIGKEKFKIYAKTAGRYLKLFGPSILVTGSGIACILTSHGILKTRNANLIAACSAIDASYKDLCKRIEEKYGKEEADNLRLGLEKMDIPNSENNEESGSNTEQVTTWGKIPSIYAKIFDRSSREWENDPELNRLKLQARQNFWNNVLQTHGYVFLNEIYRDLDIPATPQGQVVGWVLGPNNANYIDFGMFNVYNMTAQRPDEKGAPWFDDITFDNRRFVNGRLQDVLLDFNVDGVIIDKIDKCRR